MTATYSAEHLTGISLRRLLDFDPDSASETAVDLVPGSADSYFPIAQYKRFLVGAFRSVGTGAITTFKIYAATAADGTGATAVVAHALGSAPDAVGDTVWLECNVEQIHEVLATATHVGVKITLATSTDECVVYFEAAEPYFPHAGLTADYIS